MGDRIDIESIRRRHRMDERRSAMSDFAGYAAHLDRDALLAEVDRLTAENDVLRTEIANITASRQETQP